MLLTYFFSARDSVHGGQRLTGLSPSFVAWWQLDTHTLITPTPIVIEIGVGLYSYQWDTDISGDAIGQVDLLGGIFRADLPLIEADRYIDVWATRESSRVLSYSWGAVGVMTA